MTRTYTLPSFLVGLSMFVGSLSAHAQTMADVKACDNARTNPDDAITACTRFIQTRRAPNGQRLPANFLSVVAGQRAWAHMTREEYRLAIADFSMALTATTPNNFSMLTWRARAHIGLKEYHQALSDLDLELDNVKAPKLQSLALAMRAQTDEVMHDFARALSDADKAIGLDPKNGFAYFMRATVLQFNGEHDKAREDYDLAMKFDPTDSKMFAGYEVLDGAYADYLKDIQDTNDYGNWSEPPLDAFRGLHRGQSPAQSGSSAPVEPANVATSPSASSSGDCTQAEAHWKSVEDIRTVAAYEDHLARFPNCAFATLARARIAALSRRDAAGKAGVAKECPAETIAGSDGDCVREKAKKREVPVRRATEHHAQRNGTAGGAGPLDCANVTNIMACAGRAISAAPLVNGNR